MNLPTTLTWARILMVPVLVAAFYLPAAKHGMVGSDAMATAIFVGCAATDWLDGYLARRLNMTSSFGAFLDPVADKLVVVTALLLLVHAARVHAVIAVILVGRELAVAALREWMAISGMWGKVAVGKVGKWKTAFQLVAIPLLLLNAHLTPAWSTAEVGTYLLWLAAGLSIVSMVQYGYSAYIAHTRPVRSTSGAVSVGPMRHAR